MSLDLEKKYRRALLLFPKRWRAENGRLVIDALIQMSDERKDRIEDKREFWSLVRNGIDARIEHVVPEAARQAATSVSLGIAASFAIYYFLVSVWSPWIAPYFGDGLHHQTWAGPFLNPGLVLCMIWSGAFGLTIVGRTLVARGVVLLVLPASALIFLGQHAFPVWRGPSTVVLSVFVLLALSSLARPRRRLVLWSFFVSTASWGATYSVAIIRLWPASLGFSYMDDGTLWRDGLSYIPVFGSIVVLIFAIAALAFKRPSWPIAALVAIFPWLLIYIAGSFGPVLVIVPLGSGVLDGLVLCGLITVPYLIVFAVFRFIALRQERPLVRLNAT